MPETYVGGVPTGPQVGKIESEFPSMEALRGSLIPHERIEEIIGEARDSGRYKTVTDAWRRKVERQTGIVIDGRGEAVGVGFRVLNHGDQVGFGLDQRRYGARRIRRGMRAVVNTDEEKMSPEQRKVREHELVMAAQIKAAIDAAAAKRKRLSDPPIQRAVAG